MGPFRGLGVVAPLAPAALRRGRAARRRRAIAADAGMMTSSVGARDAESVLSAPYRRPAITPSVGTAVVLFAVGIVVWTLSLDAIDLDGMTDIGLASGMPPGTWASFGLITAGCALAWRSNSVPLMVTGVLATILVLDGLGVLGEPTMRFAVAWRHVGIADYIATHGSVDPSIDAYFNWPGFFMLTAFLSEVAGLKNAEPFARFAPLFFNVMYLAPLVVIGRALFEDPRIVWLGVWLFFVSNWIGQDYYSPQGLAFFMYLVVLAVLLRWFKRAPRSTAGLTLPRLRGRIAAARDAVSGAASGLEQPAARPAQRVVLVVGLILIAVTVAASHQLTPFALIASTTALVLLGATRARTLPVIFLLVAMLWVTYMAATYLDGHLSELTAQVGSVNASVNSNVGARLEGSSGHALIVHMRLIATAVLWLTAGLGVLRLSRTGRLPLIAVALAVAPFPLLALQSYGGEVLLRIALFALPFACFLAASLFTPEGLGRRRHLAMAALAVLGLSFMMVFPLTRYGNERTESFSPEEIAGVRQLYRMAPAGSVLVAGSDVLPWRYTKYVDYDYRNLTGDRSQVDPNATDPTLLARTVSDRLRAQGNIRSFLIITRSMKAQAQLFGTFRRGAWDHLERVLSASPRFRVAFRNRDATVFTLRRDA